jgi:hypothetical protein
MIEVEHLVDMGENICMEITQHILVGAEVVNVHAPFTHDDLANAPPFLHPSTQCGYKQPNIPWWIPSITMNMSVDSMPRPRAVRPDFDTLNINVLFH